MMLLGAAFSCVVGALVGSVLSMFLSRVSGMWAETTLLMASCLLAIGAAWCILVAVGGAGLIGWACNLLLAPLAYIGVFAGWTVYTFVLGGVMEAGWMAAVGWLMWREIKARRIKSDANKDAARYSGPAAPRT